MGVITGLLVAAMLVATPVDDLATTPIEGLVTTPIEGVDIPYRDHAPPVEISFRDEGAWVRALNNKLADAGFHPNSGNAFGYLSRHGVFAFQKHHGLDRDGVFTSEMWDLFDVDVTLPYRPEHNRVEIDLAKQVLYLVEDGEVSLILPVSSANGSTYKNKAGRTVRAVTPEGKFRFTRRIVGVRRSYLGSLYNPFYFYGGYAIHGSSSVPNHPASHGCVRLTNWDIDYLKSRIGVGMTIYVYGKRTPPPPPYRISHPEPTAM